MWLKWLRKRDSTPVCLMPVLDLVAEPVQQPVSCIGGPSDALQDYRLPEVHDARAHAARLLTWLQVDSPIHDDTGRPVDMLFADIIGAYTDMISDIHWERQPWETVGKHLRVLLGGHKTYAWVVVDGERHRLRVFSIPAPPAPEPAGRSAAVTSMAVARAERIRTKPQASALRAKSRGKSRVRRAA